MLLDEEAAFALFAAIAKRVLLDVSDPGIHERDRESAADFLTAYFPQWRDFRYHKPRQLVVKSQKGNNW